MGNGAKAGNEALASSESGQQQRLLRPKATAPILDSTEESRKGEKG